MHTETERKFLVRDDSFIGLATESHHLVQGYLAHDGGNTVRVRICDGQGILTIKGPSADGMSRAEWEKEISLQDARDLLTLCHGGTIDKTRYLVPEEGGTHCFEIDVFHGANAGLVMAEIELEAPQTPFRKPSWLGQEVTGDKRYYNSYLTKNPFTLW